MRIQEIERERKREKRGKSILNLEARKFQVQIEFLVLEVSMIIV